MQTQREQLSSSYPHLAAAFATIPQGEAHLRRLQDLNTSWQKMLDCSYAHPSGNWL